MQPKYETTSLCDQNSEIQSVKNQKDRKTDRKLKLEGAMILSNDIFYSKTVTIGGPIKEFLVTPSFQVAVSLYSRTMVPALHRQLHCNIPMCVH